MWHSDFVGTVVHCWCWCHAASLWDISPYSRYVKSLHETFNLFYHINSYQKEYESISMNILFLLQTMMLLSFKLRKDSHLPFIMKMLRM